MTATHDRARLNLPAVLLLTGASAFLFFFLLKPLVHSTQSAFLENGKISLRLARSVLGNPMYGEAVFNSFKIALITTLLTIVISLPPAYLMARVKMRGKALLGALLLTPLILPPFVGAVGIRQILSEYGAVNTVLRNAHLIENNVPWLTLGFWCVVIMEALHLYPILYLNLAAAWANIDPALEEAAENLGAGSARLFRTITLPLLSPGLFAGGIIVFIWSFTDLGTPLLFEYRQVVPVQIFNATQDVHTNPAGHVLAVLVLFITAACFALSRWISGRRRLEMSGRALSVSRERPLPLPLLILALTPVVGLVVLALLPHVTVVLSSFAQSWNMSPLPDWKHDPSLWGNYGEVFRRPLTGSAIKISLLCSAASTSLDLVMGSLIAYALSRMRFPGRIILDITAMLPLAIPGVVLAFGYVAAYSGTILDPRKNPIPLLIISYSVRRLPFAIRSVYAGLQQTHISLEEASLNLGASQFRTFRRITLPLVSANLIAAAMMVFAFSMLEVSDSLILALREGYAPITKAIFDVMQRFGDGPFVASAMGVLGMALLAATFLVLSRILGTRMGEMFRA